MLALREHIAKYKDPKEAKKNAQELKIQTKHFEEAMKKVRPLSSQRAELWYKNIASRLNQNAIAQSTTPMPDSSKDETAAACVETGLG